jgi:hypothetical protein
MLHSNVIKTEISPAKGTIKFLKKIIFFVPFITLNKRF